MSTTRLRPESATSRFLCCALGVPASGLMANRSPGGQNTLGSRSGGRKSCACAEPGGHVDDEAAAKRIFPMAHRLCPHAHIGDSSASSPCRPSSTDQMLMRHLVPPFPTGASGHTRIASSSAMRGNVSAPMPRSHPVVSSRSAAQPPQGFKESWHRRRLRNGRWSRRLCLAPGDSINRCIDAPQRLIDSIELLLEDGKGRASRQEEVVSVGAYRCRDRRTVVLLGSRFSRGDDSRDTNSCRMVRGA